MSEVPLYRNGREESEGFLDKRGEIDLGRHRGASLIRKHPPP